MIAAIECVSEEARLLPESVIKEGRERRIEKVDPEIPRVEDVVHSFEFVANTAKVISGAVDGNSIANRMAADARREAVKAGTAPPSLLVG